MRTEVASKSTKHFSGLHESPALIIVNKNKPFVSDSEGNYRFGDGMCMIGNQQMLDWVPLFVGVSLILVTMVSRLRFLWHESSICLSYHEGNWVGCGLIVKVARFFGHRQDWPRANFTKKKKQAWSRGKLIFSSCFGRCQQLVSQPPPPAVELSGNNECLCEQVCAWLVSWGSMWNGSRYDGRGLECSGQGKRVEEERGRVWVGSNWVNLEKKRRDLIGIMGAGKYTAHLEIS